VPSDQTADFPVLWRAKLRSTVPGVDHARQVAHCVTRGLIGIGWRIDHLADGAPLSEVVQTIENSAAPGSGRAAARTVRRFGEDAQIGDFVWTRDTSGRYLLCMITGPYRYDISSDAKSVDVHQVRPVEWAPTPLNDLEVPGGVIRNFVGTGSSFSRIHDLGARRLTPYLWEKLHNRPLPQLGITPREILTSHLDPYDVEDLVYVWLQVARGYIAMPRARKRDTPAYEWTMIHRESGRRGIVQIKTGSTPVDLAELAAVADKATDTYAFATSEQYFGPPDVVTEVIEITELLRFARDHANMLPGRVQTWFQLATHI
jgi:hypothetical protein